MATSYEDTRHFARREHEGMCLLTFVSRCKPVRDRQTTRSILFSKIYKRHLLYNASSDVRISPQTWEPLQEFHWTCKCWNSIGFWIFRSSVGFFHSGASRRGHADLGWGWSWLGSEGVQSWDGERWIEKKMGMSENPKIALASWELWKLELCYLPSLQKSCPCKSSCGVRHT